MKMMGKEIGWRKIIEEQKIDHHQEWQWSSRLWLEANGAHTCLHILHIGTSNPANLSQWCWNLRPANVQSLRKFLVRCPCFTLTQVTQDALEQRSSIASPGCWSPIFQDPCRCKRCLWLWKMLICEKKHQHSKISFQDCQPWWSGFAFLTCPWHDDKSS